MSVGNYSTGHCILFVSIGNELHYWALYSVCLKGIILLGTVFSVCL